MKKTSQFLAYGGLAAALLIAGIVTVRADEQTRLNVSNDRTHEPYAQSTWAVAKHWQGAAVNWVIID